MVFVPVEKQSSFVPVKKESTFVPVAPEPVKKDETLEELENKQNLLFTILDNVNRPQYGVANAIYQAYTNEDFKLGQSLWDGLSLKEKRSVGDTLREVIEPESKFGKIATGVGGFAGDILTDPLTYTGVGLVSRSGKLLKSGTEAKKLAKAARAAGKADGSKRVLTASVPTGFRKSVFKPVKFEEKVIPGTRFVAEPIAQVLGKTGKFVKEDLGKVSEAIDYLGKRVSTKFRPKDIDPIMWKKITTATTKAKNIQSNLELETIEKARQMTKAFRDEGLDEDAIAKITNQLETKQPITSPGGLMAKEFSEEMTERYAKTGPSGKQLIDDPNIGYVPHVLETKAKKYQDATGFNKRQFTTSSPSDIARTLLKYTDDAGADHVISTKTGKAFSNGLLKYKVRNSDVEKIISIDKMDDYVKSIMPKGDVEGVLVRPKSINVSQAKEAFKDTDIEKLIEVAQLQELANIRKNNPQKFNELVNNRLYLPRPIKQKGDLPIKKFMGKKTVLGQDAKDDISEIITRSGIENLITDYSSSLLKKGKSPRAKKGGSPIYRAAEDDAFKLMDFDGRLSTILEDARKNGLLDIARQIDDVNSAGLFSIMNNKVDLMRKRFGKISQASIDEINKGYGDIIFSTKLPNLVAIQGLRTAKVVGGDEFYKEVAKIGSRVQKPGMVQSSAPELAGKFYDPAVVSHIDKTYEALKPQELNNFMRNYDKIQNAWKTTSTFWAASFHSRNAVSNMYQNTLAGVNDPADYARASTIQLQSRKGIEGLNEADKKIMKEYREQGLDTIGHFSGDIEQSIEAQINSAFDLLKKRKVVKGTIQGINQVTGAVGNGVETNAKLAHYIAKRKEGLTPFEAGESVKKYLFDYKDLTRLEKDVFKRLMPFYTFTRKNIPLQIEALIKNPAKQTKLIKLKNNVEVYAGDDQTSGLLPEYMQNASPVFIGKKDGKLRYIKLEGFLPTADLNRLSEPAQELLALVSPLIKAPTEQTLNYNFFFGQPLTRQKGIKGFAGYGERDYLFTRIPGRLEHLARLYRPFTEIEKIFGDKYTFQDGTTKAFNLLLGGKVYEYKTEDLLRKFSRLSDEEARGLKYQINKIRREMEEYPDKAHRKDKDLKTVTELYIKKRKEAWLQKQAAAKLIERGN